MQHRVFRIRVSHAPAGMAFSEYLLAMIALGGAWLMFDGSAMSLGRALHEWMASYTFSLSLPW
mgnify:CR=1 FL=1|jgi:hypothetical protein